MKVTTTRLSDVLIIEPTVYGDDRGYFFESFNSQAFRQQTGLDVEFIQDNHSHSQKNILRGLHYQLPPAAQGKLVRVVSGEVFDVAVDLRNSSPTCGQWVSTALSAENKKQLWIPAGFAHGFLVVSDSADFLYKTTAYYSPENERAIAWNDPSLKIDWPIDCAPIVSEKDSQGCCWEDAELFD